MKKKYCSLQFQEDSHSFECGVVQPTSKSCNFQQHGPGCASKDHQQRGLREKPVARPWLPEVGTSEASDLSRTGEWS